MYNIHPEFQRVKRKETTCCCWIYLPKDSGNTAVRKYIIHLKNLFYWHNPVKKRKEKKRKKMEGNRNREHDMLGEHRKKHLRERDERKEK